MNARPDPHGGRRAGIACNLRDDLRPHPRRIPRAGTPVAMRPSPAAGVDERTRLIDAASPALGTGVRCDALHRLADHDWPVHERRGLLMLLLHAAIDPSPPVRFTALEALARVAARYPRLRPHAAAVLARWCCSPCRATALHASRLLDAPPFGRAPEADGR